jgi:hypothetical protein
VCDPDLVPLRDVQWPHLDHRLARGHLERLSWTMCGQGDWAYAYRSPSGRLAARVSPFEPGYMYFVDLCERCKGNRYVPRMELATPLEGGGHLAVLEYLHPADISVVQTFLRHWEHPVEADADLLALRQEVDAIDEWGRHNVRWWGPRVDIGERHILLSTDGNPKVIDLFFVEGEHLLEELLDDPLAFARHMPPDQCRYLLDSPDFLDDGHPADYLRRIQTALAAAGAAS